MQTELIGPHLRFSDLKPPPADFRREVVEGLRLPQKTLSPKFFYDAEGCRLFEAICDLPEYYLTRTEIGILTEHAEDIARTLGQDGTLIELGSGNSRKVRLLLEALRPAVYIPVDIAREHLLAASRTLAADYPWLDIHAACLDYSERFEMPFLPDAQRKVIFFPGSSIGNFEPAEAENLLRGIAQCAQPNGGLLIGFDLKKDGNILQAAYNDSAGVTALFNLNLLRCINAKAAANFALDRFHHHAFYNEPQGRIEMHLCSESCQQVVVAGETFDFLDGESIHTENSYKYGIEEFRSLALSAGFEPGHCWCDRDGLFCVHYFAIGSA
ncbi:L-histidine N(alpha)-methyltransferase [Methylobacter sp. BlB1]|uniref:L-histidine N(alpha)-methyltransferase n=1 Tax=Methylobacter sp. BlB1 TaxID=2785914 RepID=UPI001893750F|nr:L-histidine N(alpha)-methyltransferase [Methylobacter sp. BlB1]MBF6649657.1 L-histidine N(alpha)-methyltransferase [Methylobacter sp. BlB1]